MKLDDKPSADERDAIKREFSRRWHENTGAFGVDIIADMVLAERRDADRRVEEARARIVALETVTRAAYRLSDCLAEFGDQPGCCGEKLDELDAALLVAQAPPRDDATQP